MFYGLSLEGLFVHLYLAFTFFYLTNQILMYTKQNTDTQY